VRTGSAYSVPEKPEHMLELVGTRCDAALALV